MIKFYLNKIRQHFVQNSLKDVKGELSKEFLNFNPDIRKGSKIAIAVGSRGIDHLELIVRETVEWIKEKGAIPFIIPAMGSHGGATALGQATILKDYGITEKRTGAPVQSSMEVVEIPYNSEPNPLYMDKLAASSDGIILINKIKPHTDYRGIYESGLAKMSVIGLGKERGAFSIHQYGVYGLSNLLPEAARRILSTGRILGGIALIENAYDKTMLVKVMPADEILDREPELLRIALENRPSFPVEDIDVLILDRMGKNISGAGIDTNIIGRIKIHGQTEPESPSIKAVMVSDLTDESHGNATGVGLADVITRKLAQKIDYEVTYTNIVTSSFLERGKLPIVAETDQKAFEYALRSCGYIQPGKERIIRVKDTLHLDELYVSDVILEEIKNNASIEVLKRGMEIMNQKGSLMPF